MTYIWQVGDDRWTVAGRYLKDSGWPSTAEFIAQIETFNLPTIIDWNTVAAGTTVFLPFSANNYQ